MNLHISLFARGLCRGAGVLRRLVKAAHGVETIEFALVSIPLFMFLLGVIELSRLYWTQSELQYAAEAAARCATVSCCNGAPASCGSSSGNGGLKNYAAGQLLGMSIPPGNLSNFQVTAASCGSQVSFSYSFKFLVGALLPKGSITLSTTACYQA